MLTQALVLRISEKKSYCPKSPWTTNSFFFFVLFHLLSSKESFLLSSFYTYLFSYSSLEILQVFFLFIMMNLPLWKAQMTFILQNANAISLFLSDFYFSNIWWEGFILSLFKDIFPFPLGHSILHMTGLSLSFLCDSSGISECGCLRPLYIPYL